MALPSKYGVNKKINSMAGLSAYENGGKGSGNFGHSGRPGRVGGSGTGQGAVSTDLVAQATMLRDHIDMDKEYIDKEHKMLCDIADSIYNANLGPEHFKAEYKELYDKYGKEYFDEVTKKMGDIDYNTDTTERATKLLEEYKKSKSKQKDTKESKQEGYFDGESVGTTPLMAKKGKDNKWTVDSMATESDTHDIMEAYGRASKVAELPYNKVFKDADTYTKQAGSQLAQAARILQQHTQKMGDHISGLSTDFGQDVHDKALDSVARLRTGASLAMSQVRDKDSKSYKALRKAQDEIREASNLLASLSPYTLRQTSEKREVDVSDLFKK